MHGAAKPQAHTLRRTATATNFPPWQAHGHGRGPYHCQGARPTDLFHPATARITHEYTIFVLSVETDDGALIYITYEGRADWSEGPGTKSIFMAPKFETSDERYTWLNAVQAVGKGQLGAGAVSYEIAEVR